MIKPDGEDNQITTTMKEEDTQGKRKKIRSTAMAFLVFISETSGIRSVLQKREAHTKCDSKGLGIPNMQASGRK